MSKTTIARALAITLAPALVIAAGCVSTGEAVDLIDTVTERSDIEMESVQSVDVYLDIEVGTFTVHGGAAGLMDATFTYNVAEWKPEVEYSESEGKGVIHLSQPRVGSRNIPNDAESSWDIALTNKVPVSFHIDTGIGEAKMNLDGVQLESFELEQGVGSLALDLGESLARDAEISVDGGIGGFKLNVPEGVGIKLDASLGIGSLNAPGLLKQDGSYVNEDYGRAERNVNVRIEGGIGSITVNIGGGTAVV